MNLLFDNIIYSKETQGGISNYWYEITRQYLGSEIDNASFIEESLATENICRKKLQIENYLVRHRPYFNIVLSRLLPINFKTEDFTLYHSSFYRKLVGSPNHVEVTTLHDFTHSYFASFHKKTLHNFLKFDSIRRSKGIICVSKNTLSDLNKFYPADKLKGKSIEVIYNGVSDDYYPIKNFSEIRTVSDFSFPLEHKKFFLFVGSRASYKNFFFAASILKEFPQMRMVVVGKPFSDYEKSALGLNLLERIDLVSSIDNSKLNTLYNAAHSLIYVSSYEGFGIPILEAMRAGCPVIAFRSSAIPEVVGDHGLLLNKLDLAEASEFVRLLFNPDFRKSMTQEGFVQSEKFSWSKCAAETDEFYRRIYNL